MHSKHNSYQSEFIESLGKYCRPRKGEVVLTEHGEARISRTLPYDEVIEEMKNNGVANEEIKRFDLRVDHFLGRKSRYFECELAYPDGEVDRIDWSEYLAMKNKRKR
jgi:hypothetical protein